MSAITNRRRGVAEAATTAGWISEAAGRLLVEFVELDIELQKSFEATVQEIKRRIEARKSELKSHPYQRYLDGGKKPLARGGRPDWRLRDSYNAIRSSIEGLESSLSRSSTLAALGNTQVENIWHALQIGTEACELVEAIQSTAASTQYEQPLLTNRDFQLCFEWAQASESEVDHHNIASLTDRIGSYEAAKLVSARAAEHCVATYCAAIGHVVEDVSIGQLNELDSRWKDFDLLVDGCPIDVKNARRSFSSPESYVEHSVPKFKLDRVYGKEVSIFGTLSDYSLSETSDGRVVRFVRVLGEVKQSHLISLFAWNRRRFGDLVDLSKSWKPNFQPGWVFEFAESHYHKRKDAIERIPAFLQKLHDADFPIDPLVGWLTSLCPLSHKPASNLLPPEHEQIRLDLQSLAAGPGLTRPSIYLYVMSRMLHAIAERTPAKAVEHALRDSLFGTFVKIESTKPLGLEDPQSYVRRLLEAMAVVHTEVIKRQLKFISFKLIHPSILRGITVNQQWITLLAYCGGWRQVPSQDKRAKCGSTPLLLGANEPCNSCGYLVCNECGFCNKECERVGARQATVSTIHR